LVLAVWTLRGLESQ